MSNVTIAYWFIFVCQGTGHPEGTPRSIDMALEEVDLLDGAGRPLLVTVEVNNAAAVETKVHRECLY
jgi:hypothetical protein